MRTKEELREYARKHYWDNLDKRTAYNAQYRADNKIVKKKKKKGNYNDKKTRKLQEEITRLWHLTGELIIPKDEEIEKLIYKEELIDSEEIDYIELEEPEENNDDFYDED